MEVALLLAFALGVSMKQRSSVSNKDRVEINVSSDLLLTAVLGAVVLMTGIMGYFYFIY